MRRRRNFQQSAEGKVCYWLVSLLLFNLRMCHLRKKWKLSHFFFFSVSLFSSFNSGLPPQAGNTVNSAGAPYNNLTTLTSSLSSLSAAGMVCPRVPSLPLAPRFSFHPFIFNTSFFFFFCCPLTTLFCNFAPTCKLAKTPLPSSSWSPWFWNMKLCFSIFKHNFCTATFI